VSNQATGIEIGRLIDERPISAAQIRVVVLCALVTLLDGYDIQAMALAVPSLIEAWGLPKQSFGLALSAALIGMGIGGAFVAPLGDRVGRQRLLVWALALVGAASVVSAFSRGLVELVAWRLITGIGLGASLPNTTALTAEFAPARRRASLITLMYCNVAVGAFAGGFIAPPLIDAFGWQGIFIVGGGLPILLAATLHVAAPESLSFLLERRPGDPRIAAALARIAPGVDARDVYVEVREKVQNSTLLELLSPTFRARTLLLWTIYALNIFVMYLLISWIPTLLGDARWSRAWALRGAGVFQLGGVAGGLLLSWAVDRNRTVGALKSAFVVATVALLAFSVLPNSVATWSPLFFVLGCTVSGATLALNALAAQLYPAAIRATGIGWVGAVTRVGAATGPLVGGWLAALQLTPIEVLRTLAVPAVLCALAVHFLPRVFREVQAG
jgi:AAHS family 4-hydroxybenzoate transporter-like MFS transporter